MQIKITFKIETGNAAFVGTGQPAAEVARIVKKYGALIEGEIAGLLWDAGSDNPVTPGKAATVTLKDINGGTVGKMWLELSE